MIINVLMQYIKHEEQCFSRYLSTAKWVEKRGAAEFFFNPLQGVWIPDKKLFRVFDITSQTDPKCGENERNEIAEFCAN